MHDEHRKREFVEPTITPEASLAEVTLLSNGGGGKGHGHDTHGGSHGGGHGGEHHGGGGRGH